MIYLRRPFIRSSVTRTKLFPSILKPGLFRRGGSWVAPLKRSVTSPRSPRHHRSSTRDDTERRNLARPQNGDCRASLAGPDGDGGNGAGSPLQSPFGEQKWVFPSCRTRHESNSRHLAGMVLTDPKIVHRERLRVLRGGEKGVGRGVAPLPLLPVALCKIRRGALA